MRLFISIILCIALSGCAGRDRPDAGAIIPISETATGATEHDILVATTRQRDAATPAFFSGERSPGLDFADIDVSIPPVHKKGEIEWPRQAPGNPATDFVTRTATYLDSQPSFAKRLDAKLIKKPKGQRVVGIFVHGYNTAFDESLYRFAQMYHDSQVGVVPVLFTWASRGETTDYIYDRDSATIARDGLESLLQAVARSKADKIVIFAHSMGNWVTMEALRQAHIAGRGSFGGKLDDVILASPDIDVDLFKAQMKTIGVPKKPFILFLSGDDRALALSRFIAGGKPRLGASPEDAEAIAALGVIVVDLSKLEGPDPANHWKFAALAQSLALSDKARLSNSLITGLLGRSLDVIVTLPRNLLVGPPQP